jgi:hypothetical protein
MYEAYALVGSYKSAAFDIVWQSTILVKCFGKIL